MARTVNHTAHTLRRHEILDAAQRLLQSMGYEGMSVQDVLRELGTSKGAFYHYFDSKQALVDAVAERMADTISAQLRSVTDDPQLTGPGKLRHLFATLASVKTERRDLLVSLVRTWRSPGNALFRQKIRDLVTDRVGPLMTQIISAGEAQDAFAPSRGDGRQVGRLLACLIQDLNEELADRFLAFEAGESDLAEADAVVEAYAGAIERILGLPGGSIEIITPAALHAWFAPSPRENGEA